MKTLFSWYILTAVFVLQIFSNNSLTAQELTVDQVRNQFAQALSKAMVDPAVRNFLKTEASLQFDQDYDILYQIVKNKQVSPGRTFASALAAYANNSTVTGGNLFATDFCAIDPLLQISIPEIAAGSADYWNTAAVVPFVAVVETTTEDNQSLTVKGYNTNGSLISIDAINEPSSLTVVVGRSERVIAVNPASMITSDGVRLGSIPNNYTLVFSGSCYNFYIKGLFTPPPPPGGGSGGDSGECERDTKTTKDELYKVTMRTNADRNWAEGWLYGKLELDAHIFFADQGLNSTGLTEVVKSFSLKRTYTNNDWKELNLEVFHWIMLNNGDKMLYHWIEVDKNSFEIEVPISLSLTFKKDVASMTLGATLKYSEEDEDCGSSIVEYCDKANTPGEEYNTGRVKFKVRHRD